jgi:arylsulfatase A-like enzyme
MAREKRYKYICYDVEGEGHEQLYDMEKDPYELNNLADRADLADTKKRLRDRIRAWQKETGDPCDVLSRTA